MNQLEIEGCMCPVCKSMCQYKPGWLKPGEAENIAQFLGISLQELFNRYLMPDSWEIRSNSIRTLSPAIKGKSPGKYLSYAVGECVFFKDGLCTVHEVKPYECRVAIHSPTHFNHHEEVGLSWADHQEQILTLQDNSS